MIQRTLLPFILLLLFVYEPAKAEEKEAGQRPIYDPGEMIAGDEFAKCIEMAQRRNACLPVPRCTYGPYEESTTPNITTTTVAPTTTPIRPRPKKELPRLPGTITPDTYDLILQPNIYEGNEMDFTFNGSVIILLFCRKETNVIKIHTLGLKINTKDVRVWAAGTNDSSKGTELKVQGLEYDNVSQWQIIQLKTSLKQGKRYLLKFRQFSGILKKDFAGLYLTSYRHHNIIKFAAVSQLKPIFARKVFPCFDEPAMKAKFRVTLVRKSHFRSISNTPRISIRSLRNKWRADVFQQTLRMPTYLLAFVVSHLDMRSQFDAKGRKFQTFANPKDVSRGNFSRDFGIRVLRFFENYLKSTYKLWKIDMVGLDDVQDTAVESWGLMIFNKDYLLVNPSLGSYGNYYDILKVVSFSFSHLWFGNLVTMEWWSDAWLSHGLGAFMMLRGVDTLKPEWRMDLDFLLDMHHALGMDSGDYPSVYNDNPTLQEISLEKNVIFSRFKSSALMRMMEGFLGKEVLRKGLQLYLKRHEYNNTVHTDLWRAFSQVTNKNMKNESVEKIMNSWIMQERYPVILVTRNNQQVTCTQEQFDLNPKIAQNNSTWHIPLTWTTKSKQMWSNTNKVTWMSTKDIKITISNLKPNDWIIFNLKQNGYYRVQYDIANWLLIVEQLKTDHTKIDVYNRAQILNDAFNLAEAGLLSYDLLFNLTTYLAKENEFVPLRAAMNWLSIIAERLNDHEDYEFYDKFLLSLVIRNYERLSWNTRPGDDLHVNRLRDLSVASACAAKYTPCVQAAINRFRKWMTNTTSNPIRERLQRAIYNVAAYYGNKTDWVFLYRQMKTTKNPGEKLKLIEALGSSKSTSILKKYLKKTLNKAEIGKDDIIAVINSVAKNPLTGRSVVLNFLLTKFDKLTASDRVGTSGSLYDALMTAAVRRINSDAELTSVKRFRDSKRDLGFNVTSLNNAISIIENNIDWMRDTGNRIMQWLKRNDSVFAMDQNLKRISKIQDVESLQVDSLK